MSLNNLPYVTIIILEKPKISPYTEKMKDNISKILNISNEQIGIKATTTEKMGFIGRQEGISCIAITTITKKPCKTYEEDWSIRPLHGDSKDFG